MAKAENELQFEEVLAKAVAARAWNAPPLYLNSSEPRLHLLIAAHRGGGGHRGRWSYGR